MNAESALEGGPRAKVVAGASAAAAAVARTDSTATNFEYDDNEWDIGLGNLIIDLDADIEKTNEKNSQPQTSFGAMSGSGAKGKMVPMEHAASVNKGNLKMKIKRTKPGTKSSEAKHEIVKSEPPQQQQQQQQQQQGGGSGGGSSGVGGNVSSKSAAENVNGASAGADCDMAAKSKHQSSKRGSGSHKKDKSNKEKHGGGGGGGGSSDKSAAGGLKSASEVNGVIATTAATSASSTSAATSTTVAMGQSIKLGASSVLLRNAGGSASGGVTSTSNAGCVSAASASGSSTTTSSSGVANSGAVKLEGKQQLPLVGAFAVKSSEDGTNPPPNKKAKMASGVALSFDKSESASGTPLPSSSSSSSSSASSPSASSSSTTSSTSTTSTTSSSSAPHPSISTSAAPLASSASSSISATIRSTQDASVGTSVGTITEPECLGPCEPGTSVTLEGIVWHETEGGVLVVNVTWRGKTYVGTLLDCTKHDWAPPRFCDSPTSDLEARTPKGRGKRGRAAAATPVNDLSNYTETRSSVHSKLRNGAKGRRGPSNGFIAPPSPAKSESGKRKGRGGSEAEVEDASRSSKRSRSSSRGTPTASGTAAPSPPAADPPASPVLIECPEPNCSKKYKHINGLRYHQSHAHTNTGSQADSDASNEATATPPAATTPCGNSGNGEAKAESAPVENVAEEPMDVSKSAKASPSPPETKPEEPVSETEAEKKEQCASAGVLRFGTIPEADARTPSYAPVAVAASVIQPAPSPPHQSPPQSTAQPVPHHHGQPAATQALYPSSLPAGQPLPATRQPHTHSITVPHPHSSHAQQPQPSQNQLLQSSQVQQQQTQQRSVPVPASQIYQFSPSPSQPPRPVSVPVPSSPASLPPTPKVKVDPRAPLDNKFKMKVPPNTRPIVPAPAVGVGIAGGIGVTGGSSPGSQVPGGSLKPIQPKPTILGEPTSMNPALESLKKEKNKHKKKSKDRERERMSAPSNGGTPKKTPADSPNPTLTSNGASTPGMDQPPVLNGAVYNGLKHETGNLSPSKMGSGSPLPEGGPSREDVQSPAYSDISDANDSAPVLEADGVDKEAAKAADKKLDLTNRHQPAPSHGLPSYGMYPAYYSQAPYMVPSVPSAVSVSDKKESGEKMDPKSAERLEEKKKEVVGLPQTAAAEYQQKVVSPAHYYAYSSYYPYASDPSYHLHLLATDPSYKAQCEKYMEEQERILKDQERQKEKEKAAAAALSKEQKEEKPVAPAKERLPAGRTEVGSGLSIPSSTLTAGSNPMAISIPTPPVSNLSKDKQDMHKDLAEAKVAASDKKFQPPQAASSYDAYIYQQRHEDMRRYYAFHDQQKSLEEQQRRKEASEHQKPPSSEPRPSQSFSREQPKSQPNPMPSPKRLTPPQEIKKEAKEDGKSDSKKENISEKVRNEGVKPTMETQGPPPPPTSSYAYMHPAYMQSSHYGAIPFDSHQVYRGLSPMLVPSPYGAAPYLHPQLRYHVPGTPGQGPTGGPEDLSRSAAPGAPQPPKALDLLQHHASQYYQAHKIHELQERALKSPVSSAAAVPSNAAAPQPPAATGAPQPPTTAASAPAAASTSAVPSKATELSVRKGTPPAGVVGPASERRSPPPQRHVHTHHHTHVGLGYPLISGQYPSTYGEVNPNENERERGPANMNGKRVRTEVGRHPLFREHPIYSSILASDGAMLASQQAAAVAASVINPYPPK